MIKEYVVTVTNDFAENDQDVFISIDLLNLVSIRVSGNNDDRTVVDLKGGDSFVIHEDYEQVLKDWCDARNTTPERLELKRDK